MAAAPGNEQQQIKDLKATMVGLNNSKVNQSMQGLLKAHQESMLPMLLIYLHMIVAQFHLEKSCWHYWLWHFTIMSCWNQWSQMCFTTEIRTDICSSQGLSDLISLKKKHHGPCSFINSRRWPGSWWRTYCRLLPDTRDLLSQATGIKLLTLTDILYSYWALQGNHDHHIAKMVTK